MDQIEALSQQYLHMSAMDAGIAAVIGIVGGFIASLVLGARKGLIRYLVAGVLGSLIIPIVLGWFGLSGVTDLFALASIQLPDMPYLQRILDSAAGAAIIILIARILG